MNENNKYVLPAGSTAHGQFDTDISAERAGWEFSSLRIARLADGETITINSENEELLILPLTGSGDVFVDGQTFHLDGRESVFTSLTDYMYIPRGTSCELTATRGDVSLSQELRQRVIFRCAIAQLVKLILVFAVLECAPAR